MCEIKSDNSPETRKRSLADLTLKELTEIYYPSAIFHFDNALLAVEGLENAMNTLGINFCQDGETSLHEEYKTASNLESVTGQILDAIKLKILHSPVHTEEEQLLKSAWIKRALVDDPSAFNW